VDGLLAGFRLELKIVRADRDALIPLINAPLYTIIFLAIFRQSGRSDLESDALIAPVLIALWWIALFQAGMMVVGDRWQAMLEPAIASPANLASVLLGRIALLMCIGLVSLVEVAIVAWLAFGVTIPFTHPIEFALSLVATAFAMAGTAVTFAGVFVLARSAITFVNSASFPFYVLGGILVPVAFLPAWLQPLSSIIFLSWSADLLRASLNESAIDDFWARLAVVLLLGAISFSLGRVLLFYILRRMRSSGELATA
jgi:ABC-2 type transport system permease protein